MTCGISAIHLSFAVTASGKGISQDFLIFYKDGTEYGAIVTKAGSHSNAEDLDYLEKNISFE